VEDRLDIQGLLFRYARAADERDAAAFSGCFDNGRVRITGPGFEVTDAVENMAVLSSMFDWTMHKVLNHEYRVVGDVAEGYCYCVATHVKAEGDVRTKIDWHIRYDDRLIRRPTGWCFVSRHLDVGLIESVPLAA
jgi:hypothetical protein